MEAMDSYLLAYLFLMLPIVVVCGLLILGKLVEKLFKKEDEEDDGFDD